MSEETAEVGAAPAAVKKTFKVLVTAYRTVLVEADSSEEAAQIVAEECNSFDWEIDEWKVEGELKTEQEIATAKRHGAVPYENF